LHSAKNAPGNQIVRAIDVGQVDADADHENPIGDSGGSNPRAAPVRSRNGVLYGTTSNGGTGVRTMSYRWAGRRAAVINKHILTARME
jgi:hypothetical protein